MKINEEGNWPCEAINKGSCDLNPKINQQDISPPELMPPGTKKEAPVALSEQALLNRKAAIGHFVKSLVGLAIDGLYFGISVAVAVLTGGVGIPLAAVTGAAMIVAAGDAGCALYNLVQTYNDRSGLKTGSNSILLAVKTLMMKCGLGESKAESVGDAASFIIRGGLTAASVLLPFLLPARAPGMSADTLARVSTSVMAVLTIMGVGVDTITSRTERTRDNIDVIPKDEEEWKVSKEDIQAMTKSLADCCKRLQAQTKKYGEMPIGSAMHA